MTQVHIYKICRKKVRQFLYPPSPVSITIILF